MITSKSCFVSVSHRAVYRWVYKQPVPWAYVIRDYQTPTEETVYEARIGGHIS